MTQLNEHIMVGLEQQKPKNRIMKSTFHLQTEPGQLLQTLTTLITTAHTNLSLSHQKFYTELLRNPSSPHAILQKIINITAVHEMILVELCMGCEGLGMGELGRFVMGMFLQGVENVRWVLGNFGGVVARDGDGDARRGSGSRLADAGYREGKGSANYYRVKENSLFVASGISQQIAKIQSSLEYQRNFQQNQINGILKNRQLIQRIEPSGNEHLLYQAVDIISHHSEIFQKLTKENKQQFATTYKNLNLKPYSKLKNEIDSIMKQKIEKAQEKLFVTLDKYIGKKSQAERDGLAHLLARQSVEVQVNMTKQVQDLLILEDKRKGEKIKELNNVIVHERKKVEKLEEMLREKVKYFEQRLTKTRFDKNKDNQIAILKKSITQITSIHNVGLKPQTSPEPQQAQLLSQSKTTLEAPPPQRKTLRFTNNSNNHKKVVLNEQQLNLYQKSLMRIQFNIDDDGQECEESGDESQRACSLKVKSKQKICNQESYFCYNPKNKGFSTSLSNISIDGYREYQKSRFSFCLNVFDYGIGATTGSKNHSMLTITNMRNMNNSRSDSIERKSVKPHPTERQSFAHHPKSALGVRAKNKMKSHVCRVETQERDLMEGAMISISNRFQCELTLQNEEKGKDNSQDLEEKPKKMELKKISQDKFKIKNHFENLYFNENSYTKNKGRLNAMMTELKRKRPYRDGSRSNARDIELLHTKLQPQLILQLYLTEENAMEAELEFGVSASLLVADRKNHRETSSPGQLINVKNQEYYQQITKKILKLMYNRRKKDHKIYLEIQNAIKHPFSILKGALLSKMEMKDDLNEHQIKNFVRFITALHEKCSGRPCEHFVQLLDKVGLGFC